LGFGFFILFHSTPAAAFNPATAVSAVFYSFSIHLRMLVNILKVNLRHALFFTVQLIIFCCSVLEAKSVLQLTVTNLVSVRVGFYKALAKSFRRPGPFILFIAGLVERQALPSSRTVRVRVSRNGQQN
jgi:hypothetical protein